MRSGAMAGDCQRPRASRRWVRNAGVVAQRREVRGRHAVAGQHLGRRLDPHRQLLGDPDQPSVVEGQHAGSSAGAGQSFPVACRRWRGASGFDPAWGDAVAQERIIDLSPTDAVGDDDYTPVDSPTLGTRKVAPGGCSPRAPWRWTRSTPASTSGCGGRHVQRRGRRRPDVRRHRRVPGASSRPSSSSPSPASPRTRRRTPTPPRRPPTSPSSVPTPCRAWSCPTAARARGRGRTRPSAPPRSPRSSPSSGWPTSTSWTNGHGRRSTCFQPRDLFCLLLFLNTVAGVVDCPPQLFVGNAADGTEGAAWVHLVRLGTGALTLRAQPNGGGGGGGTVTPVTVALKKAFGGKITALPADGIEPAQSLLPRRSRPPRPSRRGGGGRHLQPAGHPDGPRRRPARHLRPDRRRQGAGDVTEARRRDLGRVLRRGPTRTRLPAVFEGTLPDSATCGTSR
jgi:hypothetical protein